MSYDVYLIDRVSVEPIVFDEKHNITGGTYEAGGTNKAWLNITWNYGKHYGRVLGEGGIMVLEGKTGWEAMPILEKAIEQLGEDVDNDYWKPTEGNARKALVNLMNLCAMAPEGIIEIHT
jgi:hypothetical protein